MSCRSASIPRCARKKPSHRNKDHSKASRRKIAALPERQREALTLCALEGMSNIEAAEPPWMSVSALGKSIGASPRALRAALAELAGDGNGDDRG